MTTIDLNGLRTALGGPEPIATGRVTAVYWAGRRPFVNVQGADVTFPDPIIVRIAAGEPVAPIELVGTAGVSCVQWTITSSTSRELVRRYTTIPASGVVDFGDLPVVDPATFEPADLTPTLAATVRQEVLDALLENPPPGLVTSVAGRVGDVTLTGTDVGLPLVDNVSVNTRLDGLTLERITQAAYDALVTPDPDTLYVITP